MNGPGHRALGLACFVAAVPIMPLDDWRQAAAAGVVAVATSSGRLFSPDADQGWLWRLLDKITPDEAILDDNGPMQHRGVTHFWLWPVLAWLVSLLPWTVDVAVGGHALPVGSWLPAAVAVGWGSHLLGDLLVGEAGQGRSAGVPLAPWWWHVGLGLKCGGWGERALAGLALPAGAAVAWWLVDGTAASGPIHRS
jgi:hypothetical protein